MIQKTNSVGARTKPATKKTLKALHFEDAISQRYMPEATSQGGNGWQINHMDVKARIGALFNCQTLSDVTFQVEVYNIPAHKFILASASPVFHKQLCEEEGKFGMEMPNVVGNAHVTLTILDAPHLAFFEFLQFIYTDNVLITLENVVHLLFLADMYKVAGLSDRCLAFIKSEVVPYSVLRVLQILRTLLLKAIVSCWREIFEKSRSSERLRKLSPSQRKSMTEGDGTETGSVMNSSPNSRRGSMSSRRSLSRKASLQSTLSETASASNSNYDYDGKSAYGEDEEGEFDPMEGINRRGAKWELTGFKGQMTETKISTFCEDMSLKCWKCIQEQTDAVLLSPDLFDQDLALLRQILRLENCNVKEINFFRAMNTWAERRCKKQGIDEPTTQMKRSVVGEETILLIRFPVMTLEEFQWEVVPTGLVPYEDVQQVLSAITGRSSAMLLRYKDEPRSRRTMLRRREKDTDDAENVAVVQEAALVAAGQKPGLYEPVPDDALDCMLAGELLRVYLKQTVVDHETRGLWDDYGNPPSSARLPPIGGAAGLGAKGGMTSPRGYGASQVSRTRPRARKPVDMVLTHRVDSSVLQQASELNEPTPDGINSRRPRPQDFERLAAGLYRFRGTHLVELWLEAGEAMVLEHGLAPNFTDVIVDVARSGVNNIRASLGLPAAPPAGRGMPLASFLCRA